uniref:NADH-ubiquinone oxidoreductase chain 5 n=1 Tax=Eulepethus nanhaiensis TaxID=1881687 RepID=A0A343W6G2_9ANNE|nr:NADH dehydrogenase subunit 5 [Eulepethus nanhaiensis]
MPYFSTMSSKLLWSLFPFPTILSLYLMMNNLSILINWNIFSINSTTISIPIILDPTGSLFSGIVLFISANVMHFASLYMIGDPYMKRFCHMVLLFVLSMNLLIYIPHLICLLLGWDGLGIVSFILVIYYQNPKSLAAGMITALSNRIGDALIILSIGLMINQGHWNILLIWKDQMNSTISILIMTAAMTKSAQMPFSSWLPAAMAAPTPVSALVHSSTLVTAGVFLLIRFYPTLSKSQTFNLSLICVSTMTMFMAGIAAMNECDMKKIIALSTLSQLGVMMASLGMGFPNLAFFHLITHALFKALMFVCAGSMIHFHSHSQDLRSMGNLIFSSPLLSSCLITANLALCGSPFLAGFYSKDLILEMSLSSNINILMITLFFLATSLTASYSIRMLITTMWNSSSSSPMQYINDDSSEFSSPMILLSLGAILSGAILSWTLIPSTQEPTLPIHFKTLALIFSILGAWMAFMISCSHYSPNMSLTLIHHFNTSMWFLTPLSSQNILNTPLSISHKMLKTLDQGWLEFFGSQGMLTSLSSSSSNLISWQKNSMTTHLSIFLLFIIIMSSF